MSAEREEVLSKINAGNIKRQADDKKKQTTKQQLDAENNEKKEEEKKQHTGARKYLSNIITFLVFVSLPLADEVIDWTLVQLLTVANLIMAAVGLQGDNVNIMLVIMCNWLVIDRAPFLYRLPGIIKEIPLYITVSYVMGNLIFLGVGYVLYVEQKAQKLTGKKKKTEMTPENEKEEQLAEFTRRKEKENRLELLFVVTLISNAVLLVAIGVIPIRDVLNGIGHTLKMVL